MSPDGFIVVTVPAFQSLFTQHDVALNHYRRYRRRKIVDIFKNEGFSVNQSGYFFGSLLPLRVLRVVYERCWQRKSDPEFAPRSELARWDRGAISSQALSRCLAFDGLLSISLSRVRIPVPGLSVWLIAE